MWGKIVALNNKLLLINNNNKGMKVEWSQGRSILWQRDGNKGSGSGLGRGRVAMRAHTVS